MMKNDLSLFDTCKKCESTCCKVPGGATVLASEKSRIENYLMDYGLSNDIILVEGKKYFTIPKYRDGCVYLNKETGECLIQEVKPIDCRLYPIGLHGNSEIGISGTCPAKDLLTASYRKMALDLLDTLTPEERREMSEYADFLGWLYTPEQKK